MEGKDKTTTNVLLSLPNELKEKLERRARSQQRSRHAQLIFILQSYFAEKPRAATIKEREK